MPPSTTAPTEAKPSSNTFEAVPGAISFLAIATWFGILAGLVEGLGLLIFQRVNFRRWGPMVHVSKEIIWISPIVDVFFFTLIAVLILLCACVVRRLPLFRVLVFVCVFLCVYDWLTLSERLYRRACLLLALGVAVAITRWLRAHRESALRFWRKSLVWLVAIWLATFAGIAGGKWFAEERELARLPAARRAAPNVIVIVVDTLRADHLSGYGYNRPTTPNIDRLAREGVSFENAIAPCSWTLPSHASLLTGHYPSEHGMQNAQPMPWLGWGHKSLRGYLTLGEALEQNGYRTGAFSANQSYFTSNVGLGRGFIHFEDYFQSPKDMFLRTLYGREFERVYLHRTEKSLVTRAVKFLGLRGLLDHRKHADEVNREALVWIERHHRPFLAFLNYIDVHDQAPPVNYQAPWGRQTEIDRYDSALSYDDAEIGKLMQELQRRGILRNTLVIITSDHGESLGQHDMQYHGIALYLEQIRVPLVIWYSPDFPVGARIKTPVSNAEVASTIMDFIQGKSQNEFPGNGLDALWKEAASKSSWPHPISELAKNDIVIDPDRQARDVEPTAMDGDMKSVVTPQWHYIWHENLGEQIYDWANDPGETKNLINTSEGQAAAKDIKGEAKH